VTAGHFPHLGLGHAAQREERVRKLLLGEAEEKVGLVLGEVCRALEDPAPARGVVLVHGVVAGGDAAGADGARSLKQLVELEVVIAERARDGRTPSQVFADEGTYDVLFEALFLVDDVVGDAEVISHAAGVVYIIQGAAAAGLGRFRYAMLAGQAGLVPEL